MGFGGPPAHVALFWQLCVRRHGWLTEEQFEQAMAATNLLPGPASTQLAIYCAWRLRGRAGAIVGGLGFIVPGLLAILALAAAFLASAPPRLLLAAGMGAGSVVAVIAVRAGWGVAGPIWRRAPRARRPRLLAYGVAGGLCAAVLGPKLVLVLLGAGAVELAWCTLSSGPLSSITMLPLLAVGTGGIGALAWTALKVGLLAFGGGFVIVPLMQADAVGVHHWMTHAQFLDAVVLGQLTPGPVTHTVAAIGYQVAGVEGWLIAAVLAFLPSFGFVLLGARHFERLLANESATSFLAGAAPAAAGAIIGSAIPLAAALAEPWQFALLVAGAAAMLLARQAVLATMLVAALSGVLAVALGAPLAR